MCEYVVVCELTRAAYPPSVICELQGAAEHAAFTCLFHKSNKGLIRFILFPDDYSETDFENKEDAKHTASDLQKELQKVKARVEVTDVKVQKNQNQFYVDSEKYPIYFDIKMIVDFDRPPQEIILQSEQQMLTRKLEKMIDDGFVFK